MNDDKATNTKQDKSTDKKPIILNAFLMGFLIGVIIYGVTKNNIGFFGLIPILIALRILNKPKN